MKFNYKSKLLIMTCALVLSTMTACKKEGNADNEKGLSYYKNGQYHSAITSFEAAIATNKKEPDFYTNLGMTYIELEEYDSALTQFELALELDFEDVGYQFRVNSLDFEDPGWSPPSVDSIAEEPEWIHSQHDHPHS